MDKVKLVSELQASYLSFTSVFDNMPEADFLRSKDNKWSAGQQLEHILKSIKPVRLALILPKFILRIALGKANRPSMSYDDLIKKYIIKLENGGRATAPFIPKHVSYDKLPKLMKILKNEVNKLSSKIESYSEEDLDKYILPHPLLGWLTIREMIYFTIYHSIHHQNSIKRNLNL